MLYTQNSCNQKKRTIWSAARVSILLFSARHDPDAKPTGKSLFIDTPHLTGEKNSGQK